MLSLLEKRPKDENRRTPSKYEALKVPCDSLDLISYKWPKFCVKVLQSIESSVEALALIMWQFPRQAFVSYDLPGACRL